MKRTLLYSMIASSLMSLNSYGHEKGDFIARVGVVNIDMRKEKSSSVEVSGIPNSRISGISGSTDFGASFSYMMSDYFAIEWILASPFSTNIKAAGGIPMVTGSQNIGKAKYLPEVISLQYYPMENTSKFQPYVGVGINYTLFSKESTDISLNNSVAGPSKLKIDNSVGLAAQLGMDYEINDKWLVNAALWYIDLETDAKIETTNIATIQVNDVEADPIVFFLSVGYKF
tara:strand:- start:635 stop:1321 length:687 start_codon:yes stop_codon:yes gene_type:complete